MKEYIEREVIVNIFCEECDRHSDENPFACSMCEDIKEIMKIPAADVVSVIRGHWIDMCAMGRSGDIYKCSVCGKEVEDYYIDNHKFCLHCGANMDGGNK